MRSHLLGRGTFDQSFFALLPVGEGAIAAAVLAPGCGLLAPALLVRSMGGAGVSCGVVVVAAVVVVTAVVTSVVTAVVFSNISNSYVGYILGFGGEKGGRRVSKC